MPRKKGKVYDKSLLLAAVREVQKGKSLSKVATTFCIPKPAWYDHSKGYLTKSVNKPSIQRSLNQIKEQGLVKYI